MSRVFGLAPSFKAGRLLRILASAKNCAPLTATSPTVNCRIFKVTVWFESCGGKMTR